MRLLLVIVILALSGCAANPKSDDVLSRHRLPPHLWSGHKELSEDVEMCALKGESVLGSLGFESVVRNGHYVYGNFGNNRAAVKCVRVAGATFVYAAVAGPEVELVERLRNEIVWRL